MRSPDQSSSDDFIEMYVAQQLQRRRNRRAAFLSGTKLALSGTMGAIGLYALADDMLKAQDPPLPINQSLTRPFFERLHTGTLFQSTEDLIEHAQEQYGVQFINHSDEVAAAVLKEDEFNTTSFQRDVLNWDVARVSLISEVLEALPSHFYQRKSGRQLQMILTQTTDSTYQNQGNNSKATIRSTCYCYPAEEQPRIVFSDYQTNPNSIHQLTSKKTIVHELAHFVTIGNLREYTDTVAKPAGVASSPDLEQKFASEIIIKRTPRKDGNGNPLFETTRIKPGVKFSPEVETTHFFLNPYFGVEKSSYPVMEEAYWQQKAAEHLAAIEKTQQAPRPGTNNNSVTDKTLDYDLPIVLFEIPSTNQVSFKSKLGYGALNISEFLSVGAEIYCIGKDDFISTYTPFLGEEASAEFYNRMRLMIFKGAEYKAFKRIAA